MNQTPSVHLYILVKTFEDDAKFLMLKAAFYGTKKIMHFIDIELKPHFNVLSWAMTRNFDEESLRIKLQSNQIFALLI